ncbi:hypothetical protein O3P69_008323 [Scylla paramamosain]|uniref:Reverse transcriptase domain-containing protein n=1 Tax=Scylla paramamosain TaxID=85552 RepID=A0AAW0SKZ2_SCYPA
MIKQAGPSGHAALLAFSNASYNSPSSSEAWKQADIAPIPKPKELGAYGPIFSSLDRQDHGEEVVMGVSLFIYVDDITLLAVGRRHKPNAKTALTLLYSRCQDLGLKLNLNKTKAMSFGE